MPKIIENLREQLLAEAKRQIAELGYAKTTIRSVAGACGVGVGTVYNYFESKDMLIASFMAEDWQKGINEIAAAPITSAHELLLRIHNMLVSFVGTHRRLFLDSDATKVFYTAFAQRHKMLRDQIAALILPICKGEENPQFLSEFISESLITWTTSGKAFEEIYAIIKNLIK